MRLRSNDPRQGFTIVELIFTSGVLAVALVGLLQLFVSCLWQSEAAGRYTSAVSQGHAKYEEIHGTYFGDILTNYGAGGTPGNTFALTGIVGRGVIYLTSLTADLIEVRIVVSWFDRVGQVVGEDRNLNGSLDPGEDVNSNGRLDSPVTLVSLVARR